MRSCAPDVGCPSASPLPTSEEDPPPLGVIFYGANLDSAIALYSRFATVLHQNFSRILPVLGTVSSIPALRPRIGSRTSDGLPLGENQSCSNPAFSRWFPGAADQRQEPRQQDLRRRPRHDRLSLFLGRFRIFRIWRRFSARVSPAARVRKNRSRRGRAEIENGEYVTLDELLHGLAATNRKTSRKKTRKGSA